MLNFTYMKSPNYNERKGVNDCQLLVIHHMSTETISDAISILSDTKLSVSAHYVIDEDGTLYKLVPEDKRAWHAGVSFWKGIRDVNSGSIGIELRTKTSLTKLESFSEAQLVILEILMMEIFTRWGIQPEAVVGHSDVAPRRKVDPGAAFPWKRFAKLGLSIWPDVKDIPDIDKIFFSEDSPEAEEFIKYAGSFGYATGSTLNLGFRDILDAFRLRFSPEDALKNVPFNNLDLDKAKYLADKWGS